jgi:hypothetical protein
MSEAHHQGAMQEHSAKSSNAQSPASINQHRLASHGLQALEESVNPLGSCLSNLNDGNREKCNSGQQRERVFASGSFLAPQFHGFCQFTPCVYGTLSVRSVERHLAQQKCLLHGPSFGVSTVRQFLNK